MDAKKIIMQVGLTENEAKVYLALLELGRSNIGKIADKGRIHRTNVYDTVKGLEKKGLAKCLEIDKSKFYEAADPENIMDMLKKKKEKLKSIIPELKLSKQLAPKKSEVHVYQGFEAFKSMLNHFLDVGKERYIIGAPIIAYQLLADFLKGYHKRRIELKIKNMQIYNFDAIERAKFLNSLPYTEARCFPKEYDAPVSTTICGDEVVMSYWGEDVPIFIHIVKKEIADSYRSYFKFLWGKAKKLE